MIEKLAAHVPPAFKPFVPALQKLIPVWMEKLKFKSQGLVINDDEDRELAGRAVADRIREIGASELRRVDLEIEGKPVTVFILGEVSVT